MSLVLVPADVCPECHQPRHTVAWAQLPLFRHGGYGEAVEHRVQWCPCGWTLRAEERAANPRLVAA